MATVQSTTYDMMGECLTLIAIARSASTRLSDCDNSDQSDEIQDAKQLLAIVVEKAERVSNFLDETSVEMARHGARATDSLDRDELRNSIEKALGIAMALSEKHGDEHDRKAADAIADNLHEARKILGAG